MSLTPPIWLFGNTRTLSRPSVPSSTRSANFSAASVAGSDSARIVASRSSWSVHSAASPPPLPPSSPVTKPQPDAATTQRAAMRVVRVFMRVMRCLPR